MKGHRLAAQSPRRSRHRPFLRQPSLRRTASAFAVLTALVSAPPLSADGARDWPQYRGPNADGISAERNFDPLWSEDEPELLWKVPLGSGFSALSIVDQRIYTLFGRSGKEYLGAFSTLDGTALWRLVLGPERGDQFGDGPRSTPVIDGETVFSVGAFGILVAADARTGGERWRVDLRRTVGARVPTWGVSAQPAVVGDILIHNAGGRDHATVALDKATGRIVWSSGSDIPGYSQPLVAEIAGRRQAVIFSGTQVTALDPEDGTQLWSEPWSTSYDVNAATPILIPPNRLFISSGYQTGAAMLEIHRREASFEVVRQWSNRSMRNQFSSSIYRDGFIYGFDNKILKCLDARTGEERWAQRGFGHGSLLWADGHLIILGDRGLIAVAETTPEAYRERSRAQVLKGKHWTVPTLYGGRLFIRNENDLACFDVSKEAPEGIEATPEPST